MWPVLAVAFGWYSVSTLAPRSIFHGTPLAFSFIPEPWMLTWSYLVAITVLCWLMGLMTRWWPDKNWPTNVWLLSVGLVLVAYALEFPILWWVYLSQVVFAIIWYIITSFRGGPPDHDP